MRFPCASDLIRWAIPLFLVPLAGCAAEKDAADHQFTKLRDEITRLQSETDRMGERLDAMEARQAATPRYAEDKLASASSPTTLSRPKLKVVRVEPGAELANDGDGEAAQPENDGSPRLLIQGEGKTLETRTMPAPVAAKTAAPANKAPKSERADAKSSKGEAPSSQ
jgi:hypothetical protein